MGDTITSIPAGASGEANTPGRGLVEWEKNNAPKENLNQFCFASTGGRGGLLPGVPAHNRHHQNPKPPPGLGVVLVLIFRSPAPSAQDKSTPQNSTPSGGGSKMSYLLFGAVTFHKNWIFSVQMKFKILKKQYDQFLSVMSRNHYGGKTSVGHRCVLASRTTETSLSFKRGSLLCSVAGTKIIAANRAI